MIHTPTTVNDFLSNLCYDIAGNYKNTLLEKIDADQLPVHWGGTQTDPDGNEYCRSKVSGNSIAVCIPIPSSVPVPIPIPVTIPIPIPIFILILILIFSYIPILNFFLILHLILWWAS